MSVQITIIGLGQVGTSIGLALAEQKSIKRVGHDKDFGRARAAQKAGVGQGRAAGLRVRLARGALNARPGFSSTPPVLRNP